MWFTHSPVSSFLPSPLLSAVTVCCWRNEHWRLRCRGHGGRGVFSGGQRWKPLWSWVSVREGWRPDGGPRWADESGLLWGHGGQRLCGVWEAHLARIQSRRTEFQLQSSLGTGFLRRGLFQSRSDQVCGEPGAAHRITMCGCEDTGGWTCDSQLVRHTWP